jgi:hypothetical protein
MRSSRGRGNGIGPSRAHLVPVQLALVPLIILVVPPRTQQTDEEMFALVCIGSLLAIILVWIWPAIWMYRDAKRRRKEAAIWLIVGLAAPIVGPIIWLVVRNDQEKPQAPAYYYYPPPAQYYPPPAYQQQQYNPYERTYYDTVEVIEVDAEEGYNTSRRDPYRRY